MDFQISVIIPTYQRADLIGETIESILAQSLPAQEVIVVDDGSTDDTEQVCSKFGDRIKYKKIENSDRQIARNTGASLSTSPWLAFCDSDDLWLPDHIEKVAKLVAAFPQANLVFSNIRVFGEDLDEPWKKLSMFEMAPAGFWDIVQQREGNAALLPGDALAMNIMKDIEFQPIWPSATCISREYFDRIGPYDPNMSGNPFEDFEFTFRGLMAGGGIGMVDRPTALIRKHGGNTRGGGLVQAIGEVVVYGYIVKTNHLPIALRRQALEKTYSRCVDAVNYAFASGQLEYVRALSRIVRCNKRFLSAKLSIKIAAAFMPVGLDRMLYTLLVRRKIRNSNPVSAKLRSRLYQTIDQLSCQYQQDVEIKAKNCQ